MIAIGVDTHKHEHVARAVDHLGQIVGQLSVPATLAGYQAFAEWLGELGGPIRVGIEGTGSFGAGLCEFLLADGFEVLEVERPRRKDRRHGKSDGIDALIAARKILAGDGLAIPRAGGNRQALAALLMVYRATVAERVRVVNQLQSLHTTAPLTLRERIGPGNGAVLTARLRRMRPRTHDTAPERLMFDLLRELAGRAHALAELASRYRAQLAELTAALAPTLLALPGVGPVSAAQLLACDARRFRNEATFARCNGTAPKPHPQAKPTATDSTAAETDKPTTPCTRSHSAARSTTPRPAPTSNAANAKARPAAKPTACSNDTSHASSTRR